jgi:hypothetical protein
MVTMISIYLAALEADPPPKGNRREIQQGFGNRVIRVGRRVWASEVTSVWPTVVERATLIAHIHQRAKRWYQDLRRSPAS